MGNAAVLKPAEEACLTALAFAELAHRAGLPDGALNVVTGLGAEAGAALASHPSVQHISFTGSVPVGKLIQTAAAENVVPVTLELGGKSPQLVFEDADVDAALPFLTNAGIQNAGQTCSASSRILVHRARYDEVVSGMASRYAALRAGSAMDDLDLGPLVSRRQRDIVEGYIAKGADLETAAKGEIVAPCPGGNIWSRPGGHPLRDGGRSHCNCQRNKIRPCRIGLVARWRATNAVGQTAACGAGVREQLRRGWWC